TRSCGARGSRPSIRAMKQVTLLEPTSSAATRPWRPVRCFPVLLRLSPTRPPPRVTRRSPKAAPQLPARKRDLSIPAGGRQHACRASRHLQNPLVLEPQIDRFEAALEHFLLFLQTHQIAERYVHVVRRQIDSCPIIKLERPAALADPNSSGNTGFDF